MLSWSVFFSLLVMGTVASTPPGATILLVLMAVGLGVMCSSMGLNWFLYTAVILFAGGMMVLFLYICSLAGFSKASMPAGAGVVGGMGVLFLVLPLGTDTPQPLSGLYSSPEVAAVLVIILYLLAGLVLAVLLAVKFEGPLKTEP